MIMQNFIKIYPRVYLVKRVGIWVPNVLKLGSFESKYLRFFLTSGCSMTFYFSFEVLLKLKPIQTNIKGGGASNRE